MFPSVWLLTVRHLENSALLDVVGNYVPGAFQAFRPGMKGGYLCD